MKSIEDTLEAIKVNLAENRKPRSITLIRKRRYFMRNRKRNKRRHPRFTKYNLRTDKEKRPNFRFDQV
jgi:hypothetical protein